MAIINITCRITLPTRYSSDQSSLEPSHTERPRDIRPKIRGEGRETEKSEFWDPP